MLSVLKFETGVRLIVGLSVVVCAVILFTGWVEGPVALLMRLGVITLIVMLLLAPLYNRTWFHFVYRRLGGPSLVYPVLDGEWHGEVRSNWPIVKRMLDISKGEQTGPYDPLTEDPSKTEEDEPIKVTAIIKSGFLDFKMDVRMDGTARWSETLSVKLDRTETGRPRIRYIFRQVDDSLEIVPTDRESHLGAAQLTLNEDGSVLSGRYWTDRVGDKGLNTSGLIEFRSVQGN